MQFEYPYGPATANMYAMCATRHMYEYGTTSEQLAWIKVAASHHAQYNPHAMLQNVVTVEDVVKSPMVASPLHRLDCCVISDGGGAIVVVKPEVARRLSRPRVKVLGAGEATKEEKYKVYDGPLYHAKRKLCLALLPQWETLADIGYVRVWQLVYEVLGGDSPDAASK